MKALGINLPALVGLLIPLDYLVDFGSGSAIIVLRKGLNGFLAFILGATLGSIGMVIVMVIPWQK